MSQPITYGGVDLTRYCFVRIERPPGASTLVETTVVPGMDGEVVTGVTLDKLVVTAHLTLKARARRRWDALRREFAALFGAKAPRVLTLPDEAGLRRYATASFVGAVTLPLEAPAGFDVEFTCHSPMAYGAERTVTMPSSNTTTDVTFEVGGTVPTCPVIECTRVCYETSSNRLWRLTDETGSYVAVELPAIGTYTYTSLEIDCDEQVVRVGGDVAALTLSSDWLTLEPGVHTLTRSAGRVGAQTKIRWTERWL